MREVSYFAPTEVGEAVKLLGQYGAKAVVLTGGTDVMPALNHYEIKPEAIVWVGNLGLEFIKEEGGKLIIGAATKTAAIAESAAVKAKAAALAEAAWWSGSPAIRSAASIGGNLGTGSPAGDMNAALVALDAQIKLVSAAGERVVAAKDYFTGPKETVRKPDELIVEVHVPIPKGKSAFVKLGRRHAQTLSVASAAVCLDVEGGVCKDARIVLGSMAPTPLRCVKAEQLLKGQQAGAGAFDEAAAQAVAESSPIDDSRATAWYRQKAAKPVVARALAQAAGA